MTENIKITGMSCNGCVASVKRALERLPIGSVDVTIGSASIVYDESQLDHDRIVEAIVDAGFEVVAVVVESGEGQE